MTVIDIFSGFLGAGKTTLIKKLISEAYKGEKLVLIENEFGEIGIDGGFLKDAGIEITEMNSGCICCSLVGDFGEALKKVLDEFHPDRILIEPSGVGKLSDVIHAVEGVCGEDVCLGAPVTVVDANKCKMYMKNFGEFFNNQVESAGAIVLSHTEGMAQDKIQAVVALLREHNEDAVIVTTPWSELEGMQILEALHRHNTLEHDLAELEHHHHDEHCDCHEHHHHHDEDCDCHEHHHHHHDEHCDCHEHHHHDEDCDCHEHHHHDEHCDCHEHHHHHDEHCDCHEHHHHHDEHCDCHEHHHHHDEHCDCGCHDHHHHADDVFSSWGAETTNRYTAEQIKDILDSFLDESQYGMVLRAKGIVQAEEGGWIHFDYVPGEPDVRSGSAEVTGRICVIGAGICEDKIKTLFGIEG